MTGHLEKPDQGASYVMQGEKDYNKSGKCTATCINELKNCVGYEPSPFAFMSGCAYCGRSGKCLRGEK